MYPLVHTSFLVSVHCNKSLVFCYTLNTGISLDTGILPGYHFLVSWALNVLVQPCDVEMNIGAGRLIALVLGLGGNWVDQPEHWHHLKCIFLYTINFCKHVLEIFLYATILSNCLVLIIFKFYITLMLFYFHVYGCFICLSVDMRICCLWRPIKDIRSPSTGITERMWTVGAGNQIQVLCQSSQCSPGWASSPDSSWSLSKQLFHLPVMHNFRILWYSHLQGSWSIKF